MTEHQTSTSLAYAVLEAIAEREDTDVADLPPLHERIDPDALDQLFAATYDGTTRGGGHVRFSYAGYVVTVHSEERVELQDRER